MTEQVQIHTTTMEMIREVPAEIDAGTHLWLHVKVSCTAGCDLRGKPIKVMAPDGVVITSELATFDEKSNETETFVLTVPKQVGEYAWSVLFPRHETGDVIHEESSIPLTFKTRPHKTSMAVWDVPLPVTMESVFRFKVGIKCSATCNLVGQPVEVRDETQTPIGEGLLGDSPWPQTNGLFWTEVEATAPATEGVFSRTAFFSPPEIDIPHEGVSSKFSFRTTRAPEHTVTVEVFDKESKEPLKDADVRVNIFSGTCNECGLGKVEVPKGSYELCVSKEDYDVYRQNIEVTEDISLKVELVYVPPFAG